MDLRKEAERLDSEAEVALAAGDLDLAQDLYKKATVLLGAAMAREEQRQEIRERLYRGESLEDLIHLGETAKRPSLRQVADLVGYSQPSITAALKGRQPIPRSVAEAIAKLRPDLPADEETYPKGWASEDHHRGYRVRQEEYVIEDLGARGYGVRRRKDSDPIETFASWDKAQRWVLGRNSRKE